MIYFLIFFSCIFSQNEELVDGVLAVVENKNILFSEVLGEARVLAEQKKINPQTSPLLFQSIFDQILKEKIHLHVVLVYAEKDSLIDVSYEEISRSLDERISMFSSQLGSVEKLEEAFGLSLGDIKNTYWETVREEIIIEKFKYTLLGNVSVSKKEVLSFYETYKDSLPLTPSSSSFSLFHNKIQTSNKTHENTKQRLFAIKDSVLAGFPFDVFIEKYSKDPSSSINKGIMTTNRGDLVPEYEKTAYSLQPGEIGNPIKTSFGYHLIKLIDRVGEKITSQHLLLTLEPSTEDKLKSSSLIDSIFVLTKNDPGLFDSLSVSHKQDKFNFSGNYNNVDISFFPNIVIEKLQNIDDFSFSSVFEDEENHYLLYKYSFNPKQKRTLSKDWLYLENLTINKKQSNLFEMWIDEQILKTYVKINKNY